MPHLQFEMNFAPGSEEKTRFAQAVVRHFSEIMDTGTDHIGVTLRTYGRDDLTFGRAAEADGRIVFLNADIRLGRTRDQKRRLALAIMGEIEQAWRVPQRSVYVIYTEHDGEHFQLSDRVLPSWSAGEDPLAGPPEGAAPGEN
ncbi:MAG TPA: tautomerase [Anaeromyxobacteraceae bacterium]|nr:tautomerase [Anaeromyxobacteraceae bacterium]